MPWLYQTDNTYVFRAPMCLSWQADNVRAKSGSPNIESMITIVFVFQLSSIGIYIPIYILECFLQEA